MATTPPRKAESTSLHDTRERERAVMARSQRASYAFLAIAICFSYASRAVPIARGPTSMSVVGIVLWIVILCSGVVASVYKIQSTAMLLLTKPTIDAERLSGRFRLPFYWPDVLLTMAGVVMILGSAFAFATWLAVFPYSTILIGTAYIVLGVSSMYAYTRCPRVPRAGFPVIIHDEDVD